jgi:hypothetical protein
MAAYRIAQPKTEAAQQHKAKKEAQQHHGAESYLGVSPVLARPEIFLVKDLVH